MSRTQEWQIKTLFHNNFSKLVITNLLYKIFLSSKRSHLRECGNAKPFGKRLSPAAKMPNHSGNDFRQPRKCQTIRETTFAERGNAKPFGKRLSPAAEVICGRPASTKTFKK